VNKYDERPSTGNKRKDTHRWCKGKIGVDHQWERVQWRRISSMKFRILKCAVCGKEKL